MNAPSGSAHRHILDRWFALGVGAASLLVYGLTLARGVYPGPSAAQVAAVTGLVPQAVPSHPVWGLLARGVAAFPVLSPACRLNLFSAACAATAAVVFYLLCSCLLYSGLRWNLDDCQLLLPPTEDDGDPDGGGPLRQTEPAAIPSPSVDEHNRRMATVAALGGLLAAFALAFSAPFWSAATSLHFQTFDLLLLFVACHRLAAYCETGRPSVATATALLCGLGIAESVDFIVVAPVLAVFLFLALLKWEDSRRVMPLILLSAAVAAGLHALGAWHFVREQAAAGVPVSLGAALVAALRDQCRELVCLLPPTGWLFVLLQTVVPGVVALAAARRVFEDRSPACYVVHALLTLVTIACLTNAPFSPWGLAREGGYLPVLGYAMAAMTAGYLVAYWRRLALAAHEPVRADPIPVGPTGRLLSAGCCLLLIAVVALMPALNLSDADGRKGAFADAVAKEMLADLDGRTWVVGDGVLDYHLLLLARRQGCALHLVAPAGTAAATNRKRLLAMIDGEPAFDSRRLRLRNAANIGLLAFVGEWLSEDPMALKQVVAVGQPEIWRNAGRIPVPDRLFFGGAASLDAVRAVDLLGRHQPFWDRMADVLSSDRQLPPALGRMRAALRRQVGRVANELGVLCEDLGRDQDAFTAYGQSRRLDPSNVSALLNLYGLAVRGHHPESRIAIEAHLRQWAKDTAPIPVPELVRVCGSVRRTDVFAQQSRNWALAGQPRLARAELERAIDLDARRDTSPLRPQYAALCLNQGDAAGSEHAYRAILAADPADARALAGMVTVSLCQGRSDEARQWLETAQARGVPAAALRLPTAAHMIAAGQFEAARASLYDLTDHDPANLAAWSLLAEVLLKMNAAAEVERRVLPRMREAVGRGDHPLLHVVNGYVQVHRGPAGYAAARAAFLHALSLTPDLPGIRDELLRLDVARGLPADIEHDAMAQLRRVPDDAFANYLLGAALLARGEPARAEDHLRRSIAGGATAAALNDLAEALRRLKQTTEAERTARQAIALDTSYYPAWDTLGCVLLDAGRLAEAASALEKALALCNSDPRPLLSLARVRAKQGRREEANGIVDVLLRKTDALPDDVRNEMTALRREMTERAGTHGFSTK